MMKANTSKKTLKTTVTTKTVLEGVETLRADILITTFEVITNRALKVVSKRQIDAKVEHLSFPLIEVEPETLTDYRRKRVPSFVLKVNGKFFYSKIQSDINLVSSTILGAHRCASIDSVCNRLSAATDEEGGCEKVRDSSNHIERYPWITMGYETFNTKYDTFLVVQCLHCENCQPNTTH